MPPATLKNRGGLTASPRPAAGDATQLRGTPKDLDTKRPLETGGVAGLATQGMVTARDMKPRLPGPKWATCSQVLRRAAMPHSTWMLFTGQMVAGGRLRAPAQDMVGHAQKCACESQSYAGAGIGLGSNYDIFR